MSDDFSRKNTSKKQIVTIAEGNVTCAFRFFQLMARSTTNDDENNLGKH